MGTWTSIDNGWYCPCSAQHVSYYPTSNFRKRLTEQLSQTSTTREQEASRRIKIRTELREGSNFTVLRKVELERTRELLHDLGLRRRTDTGHGETDVDGGPDTTEEQLSLQEDLTVGNGNDLNRDDSVPA